MLQKISYLALAGAVGTVARFSVAGAVQRWNTTGFPWGTLAVNVIGCFLAGLLWVWFEHRWAVSAETRLIVLVGFMGAFTTFSAFILESGQLFRAGGLLYAAANVLAQNVAGFAALAAGVVVARLL